MADILTFALSLGVFYAFFLWLFHYPDYLHQEKRP